MAEQTELEMQPFTSTDVGNPGEIVIEDLPQDDYDDHHDHNSINDLEAEGVYDFDDDLHTPSPPSTPAEFEPPANPIYSMSEELNENSLEERVIDVYDQDGTLYEDRVGNVDENDNQSDEEIEATGVTSQDEENVKEDTLVSKFYALADANKTALKPALVAYNDRIEVEEIYTWEKYADRVTRFKNYLLQGNFKNTAIHAFNSPEWFVAAMGSIAARCHVAGIYNTNTDRQCLHVIKTGECDVLVVDTFDTLVQHYSNVFPDLLELQTLIMVIDHKPIGKVESIKALQNEPARNNFEMLMNKSIVNFDVAINETTNSRTRYKVTSKLDDTVTLIFTSGTTSDPKAVKITHRNIICSLEGVLDRIPLGNDPNQDEVVLSYLPLSHVAGQCLDIYSQIYHKGEVHFARPDALRGSLKKSLLAARPTVFLGVPRVWEKIREGLLAAGKLKYQGVSGSLLKGVANSAKAINYSYQQTVENAKESYFSYFASYANYPAYYLSSGMTSPVKTALGFDRCKYFASGAAPITAEILEYFMSLNMPIHEIYGMSETAGIISISDPFSAIDRFCGCPAKGVDVKIDPTTSEILVKGHNVFTGYHNYNGDISDLFDEDGYFRTGDCGIMENNKLKITGRLKELIITAGGENIPPVLIEDHIKREADTDSQMMVIGDQKKFLTILIFNPESEPQLTEEIVLRAITTYNNEHAISRSQKIQKFKLIREELTVESGLLTPTMKMKRKIITDHYKNEINEIYEES